MKLVRPTKPRASSIEAAVQAARTAREPLPEPPAHVTLRAGDRPFWDAIIRSKSAGEWSAVDLVSAAQLAAIQYDLQAETVRLRAEGSVVVNEKGALIRNPRGTVVDSLMRTQLALLRSLRIVAATPSTNDAAQRRLEREAQGLARDSDPTSLLQ